MIYTLHQMCLAWDKKVKVWRVIIYIILCTYYIKVDG